MLEARANIQQDKAFFEYGARVAHDIRSPLATFKAAITQAELPMEKRRLLYQCLAQTNVSIIG